MMVGIIFAMDTQIKSRVLDDLNSVNPALKPFLPKFYQDRIKELEQMKEFQRSNDLESLRKLAHSWKGFCAPYGFATMGELANELERQLREGDKPNTKYYIDSFQEYLDFVEDEDVLKLRDV